ncbi:alpha/beta fold hydrolase [Knoellia sp. LjRoot47]|uniref:alpha/beta fold hydrolase n=1 Tax=Knoellia sp. LjRoot47 TaxID=3342330 RepID=UPI003ECC3FD1
MTVEAPTSGTSGTTGTVGVRLGDAAGPGSRARLPDDSGVTTRDGVQLTWETFGCGATTLLLMPTWSIVPSRIWKGQVAYLARHFRVVTFDGRGSGASGRPTGATAYTNEEYAADAVAVMDAAGVEQAVLVSLSCGGAWSVHVATSHPERVLGLFAIAPSCGFALEDPHRDHVPWDERLPSAHGWEKYNKYYWLEGDYDDFVRFFFRQMFSEPHSTKQIEDAVAWGHEISPQTLADTTAGRIGCDGAVCSDIEALCRRVTQPVTVLHGSDDRIRSLQYGERLAELTGGELVVVEGAGHGPLARDPVLVNHEIRRFAQRFDGYAVRPRPAPGATPAGGAVDRRRTHVRAASRRKQALYISSPIGLGHARRDLAVADELRTLHPDLDIQWLAQDPVTRVLAARGESVHPASAHLASESGHVESESGEHDLHAFRALRRMDEILVNNFMVFDELMEREPFDLVIGDEAWDVDYFLHENPELKRARYAWFTDFVGWLPMPDGGDEEASLTADLNAEMLEQRARFRGLRDRSIFVGNPDDIVPDSFGSGLPSIREWTESEFDFAGYVTGFDPTAYDIGALRERLGHDQDERVCVVSVGGSGVGLPLLRRVLDAVPLARRVVPELRFVIVTGPRIDPRSLPETDGVEVVGFLPDLTEHLAASDVALTQGGLTTCMELTALRKPFLHVPLRHHFEQNFHVRRRLERYRAGTCLDYSLATDPDALASMLVKELDRAVDYRPVETDGAARAAAMLAELL